MRARVFRRRKLFPTQREGFRYAVKTRNPALLMEMRTKHIRQFESYTVSDTGEVKNSRGWILKLDRVGRVTLCNLGIQRRVCVSVLVLENFKCRRPKGKWALHRDDDKSNNCLTNLYWGTPSENVRDSIRNGHHKGNTSKRDAYSCFKMSVSHLGKRRTKSALRKFSRSMKENWAHKTAEERLERSRKIWETRRRNASSR